jgi:4a-hydroxytetrahydrobiopterin dehydratase
VTRDEGHKMEIEDKICKQSEVRALSNEEVIELIRKVPQWSLKNKTIEREFKFKDFREAMEFVNKVAAIAEAEDHHPDICISYDKVQLTLSTHKVGGLSCKDFVLGAKINLAVESGR